VSDIAELTVKVESLTKRIEALEKPRPKPKKPTKEDVRKECYDEDGKPKKYHGLLVRKLR
jgi:hypothetical protein